jgi:hypothetical protein
MRWEWTVNEAETRTSLLVSALWRTFFLAVTVFANWGVFLHPVRDGDIPHRLIPQAAIGFALAFWGANTVVFWLHFAWRLTRAKQMREQQKPGGAALGPRSMTA